MKTAFGAPLTTNWPKLAENNIFQPTTNRLVCIAEVKRQKGIRNYEFYCGQNRSLGRMSVFLSLCEANYIFLFIINSFIKLIFF